MSDRRILVVGTAGTVSTGAVDPLARMAAIARKHDLWFHADGAYGAMAAISPRLRPLFRVPERADSVAWADPHKWLYSPLEAGCALVRHPGALRDAFSYSPPYYRFDGEAEEPRTNYFELELGRVLSLSAPNLTLLLDRMQQRGLVQRERHPRDGRSQLIVLTDAGHTTVAAAEGAARQMELDLQVGLTPAEHAMLIELLGKLAGQGRV